MKVNFNNLSEVVIFRLKELKMTRKAIAEKVGIDIKTLRTFEAGGNIRLDNLKKILDLLKIRLIPIWEGQDKTDILKQFEDCPLERLPNE